LFAQFSHNAISFDQPSYRQEVKSMKSIISKSLYMLTVCPKKSIP